MQRKRNVERTKNELKNTTIEQVNTFKYFGIHINNRGDQNTVVNAIIDNASKVNHNLRNTFIGKKEVSEKQNLV